MKIIQKLSSSPFMRVALIYLIGEVVIPMLLAVIKDLQNETKKGYETAFAEKDKKESSSDSVKSNMGGDSKHSDVSTISDLIANKGGENG